MSDPRASYPVSFYFEIKVDGQSSSFREMSGISSEMSVEEVARGGENRFKYRLPMVSSTQNLTLKQGVLTKDDGLLKWCHDTIDGGLSTAISPKTLTVSLLDAQGQAQMRWVVHKAYPVKFSISDLKSMENEILVESIELAYNYFEVNPTTA